MKFYLLKLTGGRERLETVLSSTDFQGEAVILLDTAEKICQAIGDGCLRDAHLLFAMGLDETGINLEWMKVLKCLHLHKESMIGSIGGVIVDGPDDLYTKDGGRRITFAANMAGCTFPGKSLVEATGSLRNFDVLAKTMGLSHRKAYEKACSDLVKKILDFHEEYESHPRVLMVHASIRKTSNSLMLWSKVAEHLKGQAEVEEISIRNGEVWDCRGCKYETCVHFGENSSCFYGGVMVEKVYPAIVNSDVLVLICPNYNDAVSANIMAFINRLTAVFRTNDFSRKRIYALVVSGYSGGDIVAQQILGAINMNKNFILPGKFALLTTANAPGSILQIDEIDELAECFAENILLRE